MTCASCAARVERQLNEIDGVQATVNLATEHAHVVAPPDLDAAFLVREIQAVGYTAAVRQDDGPGHDDGGDDDLRSLRRRVLVTAALAVPVIAMAMIRALQFDGWQWVSLVLATPIVTWAALPLHRATLANLRHGAASMDTLVSVGIIAAFGWSLYALLLGGAGEIGMEHGFSLTADPTAGGEQIYLEVAAGVTLFILVGRYLEARAGQRSSAALHALIELGAKDVSVVRNGREERVAIDELAVGDHFVVRPGEKVATDGLVESGSSAIDASLLTGESVPVEVGPGGRGDWSDDQHRREPGGAGDSRRERHGVGADRQAGRSGPVGQGSGSAAGRPRVRGVRSKRDRIGSSHPGLLAQRRDDRRHHRGVHRSSSGPDHRLPLRPGAGYAHRAHGGQWPWRRSSAFSSVARRSSNPPGPSTRSCSTRPARSQLAGWRCSKWRPPTAPTADEVLRSGRRSRGSERAPHRSRHRRRRPRATTPDQSSDRVREHRGVRCLRACRWETGVGRTDRQCRSANGARARRHHRRRRGAPAARPSSWAGTRRRKVWSSSATPCGRHRAEPSRDCVPSASARSSSLATTSAPPEQSPPRWASKR